MATDNNTGEYAAGEVSAARDLVLEATPEEARLAEDLLREILKTHGPTAAEYWKQMTAKLTQRILDEQAELTAPNTWQVNDDDPNKDDPVEKIE